MTPSELGAYMRRHREERGWDLDEVEAITHIRRPYLESIEEGDWDALPPSVYTRGLLRNYARALGVSQASVMRMYVKERPHEAKPPEPQLISQPLVTATRLNFEFVAAVVLLAVSAVLLALVVRSQLPMPRRASATGAVVPGTAGTGTSAARTGTPGTGTSVAARATGGTARPAPTLGARQAAVPIQEADGTPIAATPVTPGTPQAGTAASAGDVETAASSGSAGSGGAGSDATGAEPTGRRTGTPPAASPSAAATTRAEPTVGPTPTPAPGEGLAVSVAATSRIWILAYTDGREVFQGFLDEGQTRRWTARERFGVRTGNAGGTQVTVNGERIPALGGRGDVVEYEWRLLPSGDIEQREL